MILTQIEKLFKFKEQKGSPIMGVSTSDRSCWGNETTARLEQTYTLNKSLIYPKPSVIAVVGKRSKCVRVCRCYFTIRIN